MSKYTSSDNLEVDKQLQVYLDTVVEIINKKIDKVVSVILSGGFGRGEGSFLIEKGKVCPLNDFDVYVVTKNKISEDILNEVASEARNLIGTKGISMHIFERDRLTNSDNSYSQLFYVDLKAFPLDYFRHLPPIMRYYDLKNAGSVIGGKNVFSEMADYKLGDLPKAEGLRLLLNRMSHLIQFPPIYTNKKRSHQLLIFHVIKAYLACAGALLQLSGKYQSSYKKNMEILEKSFADDFPELHKKIPGLPAKIREFTEFRMQPNFSIYTDKDFNIWHEAKEYIGVVSQYFLSEYIGKKINNWDDFSIVIRKLIWPKYYNPYLKYYLKKNLGIKIENKNVLSFINFFSKIYFNFLYFKRMLRYQNKFYPRTLFKLSSPELSFFSALPYLLYSVNKDQTINIEMLEKGRRALSQCCPVISDDNINNSDYWSKLALDYSNAYILFSFLKAV